MHWIATGLLWILAVAGVIYGAVLMIGSVYGGIAALIGALLLFPPVGEKLSSIIRRRWILPAVGLIVALIVAPAIIVATAPTAEEAAAALAKNERLSDERAERRKQAAAKKEADRVAAAHRKAEEKRKRGCSDYTMAFVMSQNFVRRSLKAPSTAKFPSFTADGVASKPIGNCKFLVVAYVDAQNSFGAMIRTSYILEMEYLPDTERWRGANLQM